MISPLVDLSSETMSQQSHYTAVLEQNNKLFLTEGLLYAWQKAKCYICVYICIDGYICTI